MNIKTYKYKKTKLKITKKLKQHKKQRYICKTAKISIIAKKLQIAKTKQEKSKNSTLTK